MGRVLRVTEHAIARYCERVAPVGPEAALAALSGRAVQAAADFGARIVRLGKARAVLDLTPVSATVITVLPAQGIPVQLQPIERGGPVPVACDLAPQHVVRTVSDSWGLAGNCPNGAARNGAADGAAGPGEG